MGLTLLSKSNKYRQRQYFEQRKRQQQQHTDGLEGYADGRRSCTENNRSLDILSLANVSNVVQEHKARSNNGNKSDDFGSTLNCQYELPYHPIFNDEALHVDQAEINEERTSSSYGTEAEKVSIHLPDHNEELVGNGNKLDPFKFSETLSEISVIDLLSDSGANTNTEENSARGQEAHVAFSIEGLGKVAPETPLHSPKLPGRSYQNVFSPQRKARRQPTTSNHTDYGFHDLGAQLDVVMQDVDFSPYCTSMKQTLCSKNMPNIIDDQNPMFSNRRGSSPFNWDGSNSHGASDIDELVCNIRENGINIWDGTKLLDDSIDDLREHEPFCKNWSDQLNVPYDDCFHDNDFWKEDFSFDGWNLQKKRFSTKRTEDFDIRESPVPYKKHQTAKDLYDKISNTRYSAFGVDDDVKCAVNRSVKDDNRESSSLLSQESCSSKTVTGDAIRKS